MIIPRLNLNCALQAYKKFKFLYLLSANSEIIHNKSKENVTSSQ